MMNKYYSLQESCEILQITRTTLWKMRKKGEINAIQIGERKKFISKVEIERYLNKTPKQNGVQQTTTSTEETT